MHVFNDFDGNSKLNANCPMSIYLAEIDSKIKPLYSSSTCAKSLKLHAQQIF